MLTAESLAKLNLGFTFQVISTAGSLGQLDSQALLNLHGERKFHEQPFVKPEAAQLLQRGKSKITRNQKNLLQKMVRGTGIEPVTPTMSR